MQSEQLRALIRRETFQPFRLYLKDGRIFDLPQFGLMLVFNTYVLVGVKAPREKRAISEHMIHVSLELIDRVEMLRPAEPCSREDRSMTQEQLLALLRQRPFQPFRLHLTDGRVFDLVSPRLGMACRTLFTIGVPDAEEPERYAEYFVHVDYPQISQVEILSAANRTAP